MFIGIGAGMAPHREKFDIDVVLKKRRLGEITALGMSVYDSGLNPIAVPSGPRLCTFTGGDVLCSSCRIHSAEDFSNGQWFTCVPGVSVFIAPVNVHGRRVGFVASEQVRTLDSKAENLAVQVETIVDELRVEIVRKPAGGAGS